MQCGGPDYIDYADRNVIPIFDGDGDGEDEA